MALPIQATPTYTCELPSTGTEVKFRPFLVKEQKILVIAQESEDPKTTLSAVKDLINNVTFEKVNANELTMFDLEYLFCKIRAVSVGETIPLKMACMTTDCNGTGETVVNLDDLTVTEDTSGDPKIMISDDVGIVLRYPKVKDMGNITTVSEDQQSIEVIKASISQVFDAENVYDEADMSADDKSEFVESLTFPQIEKLSAFFLGMPKLQGKIEYKCNTCGKLNERVLEGLQSFF